MLYYPFIEPDTRMAKNQKAVIRFFSALSALDKTISVRTKPVLSRFDVIYLQSRQTWYV